MTSKRTLLSPDSVLVREDFPTRRVGDETMLLHLSTGEFFKLNETGLYIWGCIDGKRTAAGIAKRVVKLFAVDDTTALKDTIEFLGELLKKGLALPARELRKRA